MLMGVDCKFIVKGQTLRTRPRQAGRVGLLGYCAGMGEEF